jgi:formylglycine-generating enzyme required for sulfatase activity
VALGRAGFAADSTPVTRAVVAAAPVVEQGGGGGSTDGIPHEPLLASEATGAAGVTGRTDCPDGMLLVEGEYCPRVEQRCLRWMDPPGRFHEYRCAEYAKPARCAAPRVHRRYCIDRRERSEADTGLPLNVQSWTDAKVSCERAGARVCAESEWTFACEGEEMRPYPYGWSRAADKCNADHFDLLAPAVGGSPRRLRDERAPAGAHPECSSAFGLLDMAGNVAEWVSVDGFAPGSVVVQKGNWWQPGKHACRDAQYGHDRRYKGTETGFRCCADAATR